MAFDSFKKNDAYKIHIFESEYYSMVGELLRYPDIETGGDLYGTFTHGNIPIIWLASGPGPNAERRRTEFHQDPQFTTEWQRQLHAHFGIQYIGSWHSHHQLRISQPSHGDVKAVQQYANRHNRSISIEVIANFEGGKGVLRPYLYTNARRGEYMLVHFESLPEQSPLRPLISAQTDSFSGKINWTEVRASLKNAQTEDTHKIKNAEVDEEQQEEYNEVPAIINIALSHVARHGIELKEISMPDKTSFNIPIALGSAQLVTVCVEVMQESLNIKRVILLDQQRKRQRDIVEELHYAGVLSTSSEMVLSAIVDYLKTRRIY